MPQKEEIKWKDGIARFLDDDGTIVSVSCKEQILYYVYTLYLKDMPVYVGCTTCIEKRLATHRHDKTFDGYKISYQSPYRRRALNFEIISIEFLKSLGYDINYNKQKKIIPSRIIPVVIKKHSKVVKNG